MFALVGTAASADTAQLRVVAANAASDAAVFEVGGALQSVKSGAAVPGTALRLVHVGRDTVLLERTDATARAQLAVGATLPLAGLDLPKTDATPLPTVIQFKQGAVDAPKH